jgi:tetratricopeptide (TPR) repeat protein
MNRRARRVVAKKAKAGQNASGDAADKLCEAGSQHFRAGRHLEAQIVCQQVLATEPQHADAQHLMGLLLLQDRQFDHAVAGFSRAIRQDPKAQYLCSLGNALNQQGRLDETRQVFEKAVQLKPDDAELWKHLGGALLALNRPGDAVRAYQQAVRLSPWDFDAAYQSGTLLCQLRRFDEALSCLDLCDRLLPDHAATHQMRALALYGLKRFEDGLAEIRRAHALEPNNADVCNNIGVFLRRLGREDEALPWFDQAVKLRPDSLVFFENKAIALCNMHRFTEAIAAFNDMKAVDPVQAEYNIAFVQLLLGNFELGWVGRESRWRIPGMQISRLTFSEPMWLARPSSSTPTRAWEILFSSCATRQWWRRAARRSFSWFRMHYTLCCGDFRASRNAFQDQRRRCPAFDFRCPLSTLPLAFDTRLDTIPAKTSYLPAPTADRIRAWEERLGAHDRLRVGLVWSGNPAQRNDSNRSMSFRTLARILDVDATFVSLQKDPRPEDKALLAERNDIVDLTAHLTDFAETAALISCLDLVVSVDTSVVHLSGALGCPTWVMLCYTPDYRWLLDRDDSPWYPTMRLFRQTQARDYADVVDRVRIELNTLTSANSLNMRSE